MLNRQVFYKAIKTHNFNGKLPVAYYESIERILNAWEENYAGERLEKLAYILATVQHECRFNLSIRERGLGKGHPYGKPTATGHIYYGRGASQITWEANYRRMGEELGLDLVMNPDLALNPEISVLILMRGMMKGMFTGKKVGYTMKSGMVNFYLERKVVNGLDKASLIAGYARGYLSALQAAAIPEIITAATENSETSHVWKQTLLQVDPERDKESKVGDSGREEITGKKVTESTTVWAKVGETVGVIGTLMTQINGLEKWAFFAVIGIVVTAAAYIIYERHKKYYQEGV